MEIEILDECSYVLNDGRYVQVQAISRQNCYVYFFIVNTENDNSVAIENIVLTRVPELILDCRQICVINAANIVAKYVVQSVHFTNYVMHYRIGQKYLFRISKVIPTPENDDDEVNDGDNPTYLDLIDMTNLFAPNTYYGEYKACPSTKALKKKWFEKLFLLTCNSSAIGTNLNKQYSLYLFIEAVHNGIQHALEINKQQSPIIII